MRTLLCLLAILLTTQVFAQKKPQAAKPRSKPKPAAVKPEKPAHGNFAVSEEIVEAKYQGTEADLIDFFMREIVFSDSAVQANLEGAVTVKFLVDEKGVPGEISIVKGMGYGIDEEVIRLAPQLKYFPARIGDLPIKMEQLITIPLRAYRKQ